VINAAFLPEIRLYNIYSMQENIGTADMPVSIRMETLK